MSASTVSAHKMEILSFVQGKTTFILYLRHFRLDETAETDVSEQLGRRKTAAELHTSSAKRAKTWQAGAKW